jgi:hypothetical protein
VNDLRHGLEGIYTEGHELDRKRQVPKESKAARMSDLRRGARSDTQLGVLATPVDRFG